MNNIETYKIRIYRITSTSLNSDWCYVGKTKQKLEQRWKKHKNKFNSWLNGKKGKYCWFKYAIEIDDTNLETFEIYLLEEAQVQTKTEEKILERKWIERLKSCNKQKPGRTRQEYEKLESMIQWRMQQTKCGCGGTYTNRHKARHEQTPNHQKWLNPEQSITTNTTQCECGGKYTTDHKNQHFNSKTHKEWENTGQVKTQINLSYDCPCGGTYTNRNKPRHIRTNHHQQYIQSTITTN